MSITLHTTGYGAGATALLADLVGSIKGDSPLTPVTVVVPSNFVGISARRMLAKARPGGVIGLSILTVFRLAELLGASSLAAQGRRPVSTPVVGAAIRRALSTDPGIFHRVHDHPATEASLIRAHRELSDLTDDALAALAATSNRAGEVVRIHRAATEALAADWYDEADLMAAATQASRTSTVLDDLGTVVLHLPQRLTPAAAGMVQSLAERTDVHVIAGLTGHAPADAEVGQALARLGLDVPDVPAQPIQATRILTVSDAEEEARTAVAEVVTAARGGTPLERVAVLYPSAEPYARIVADHLEAAGIGWNGRAVRPLSDRLAGRWLMDLLQLVDSRWSRPEVLGVFASAPGRGARHQSGKVAAWERISREAGIVDGRDAWADRLESWAAKADQRVEIEAARHDDPGDWRAERARREAADARSLAEYVEALDADLAIAAELTTWPDLADWAKRILEVHLGAEDERMQWPDLEQDAAQKVEAALDRLHSLQGIEPTTDLATFTRALALELDDDLGRKGRFGEGVLVGTLAAGLGVDLDVVVVLGMAEGVLPTRPKEDSLLADADRAVVADQLPPRTSRVGAEQRRFLAAVAAASTRVLVFPRGDLRRSVERAPSRWLRQAVEEVTGQREVDGDLVTHVPSYAGRIATTAFANDEQELLLAGTSRRLAGARLDPELALKLDAVLVDGVALLAGRGRPQFTKFNGNLAEVADLVARDHDQRQLSASAIEQWLSCPHGYLASRILRVEPVENPEEQLQISALDRGTLVHDVLERWLREQIDEGSVPAPDVAWSGDARVRLLDLAEQALDDIAAEGVVGHPLLWRRDRRQLQHEFVTFLEVDDQRRAARGLTPIHVEAPFGFDDQPPLLVDLANGRSLRFRGMIDRLDRTRDGGVLVTDYKTGSTRSYKGLGPEDPDAGGSRVQLMLYGLAARQILADPDLDVHATYWFTSDKGGWGDIGYPVTPEVEARLLHLLGEVDDQIRAGVFPQRPEAPGWKLFVSCHHCDPDGLGTAARHREYERLVGAPDLARWITLTLPEVAG